MVSWRESGNNNAKKEVADFPDEAVITPPSQTSTPTPARTPEPVIAPKTAAKESIIASDLNIEGKIEGSGHVRIAGKFKGDVNVKGDLTVEQGAKVTSSVRAEKVTLSGELEGNIEAAKRVDLLASSALNGDIKADDLTVASGARLRGHVECGWTDVKTTSSRNDSRDGDSAAA